MAQIPEHLVDKRIVGRNIQKGLIDRKRHAKYLEDLPDRSEQSESVKAVEEAKEARRQGEQQSSDGEG